jgi:hypothetical protein
LVAYAKDSAETTPATSQIAREYIRHIRGAIEHDPRHPGWIRTIRGRGYLFDRRGLDPLGWEGSVRPMWLASSGPTGEPRRPSFVDTPRAMRR